MAFAIAEMPSVVEQLFTAPDDEPIPLEDLQDEVANQSVAADRLYDDIAAMTRALSRREIGHRLPLGVAMALEGAAAAQCDLMIELEIWRDAIHDQL